MAINQHTTGEKLLWEKIKIDKDSVV